MHLRQRGAPDPGKRNSDGQGLQDPDLRLQRRLRPNERDDARIRERNVRNLRRGDRKTHVRRSRSPERQRRRIRSARRPDQDPHRGRRRTRTQRELLCRRANRLPDTDRGDDELLLRSNGPHRKTVSEGTTKATVVNHYPGPGEAISWSEEESKQWTREIPGIDGALVATQHDSEPAVLQLHDLDGAIVATAAATEQKQNS